jgi:hypothetical protein
MSISASVAGLNGAYQAALGSSVWANYQQVGTQWTRDDEFFADTLKTMYPDTLGNTTLESFEQFKSSCMGCHNQMSGLFNNELQGTEMGNIQYVPISEYFTTNVDGQVVLRVLHSDFMWSANKSNINGHLTWRQIRGN